jgi:hypothetical protein
LAPESEDKIMFDNLVESSSHKDDLTRKGSFIGITALIYAVLIGGFLCRRHLLV